MKIFKLMLPVLINILSTILFFAFVVFFLFRWLGPDWVFVASERESYYRFSRGSISVSFIIWLFLATIIYVVRVGKKHLTLGKRSIYYICSIGIVGIIDLWWGIYYNRVFFLWW